MRVLWYHAHVRGGGAANSLMLAQGMRRQGIEVVFGGQTNSLRQEVAAAGFAFHSMPLDRWKHPSAAAARYLTEVVREGKFDAIWPIDEIYALDAYLASWYSSLMVFPLYVRQEAPPFRSPVPAPVATNTPAYRDHLLRHHRVPPEWVLLIRARVDVEQFRSRAVHPHIRRMYHIPPDHVLVALIGRLSSTKGGSIHTFLQAATRVAKEVPQVTFLMVGDGEIGAQVRATIARVNQVIGRRAVVSVGEVPFGKMADLLNQVDVVVGMASTCILGMLCERPVVVIGNRGFAEVITPETVEDLAYRHFNVHEPVPDGIERLVGILRILVRDVERRVVLGRSMRTFAVETYDAQVGASQVAEALLRLSPHMMHTASARAEVTRAIFSLWAYRARRRARRLSLLHRVRPTRGEERAVR